MKYMKILSICNNVTEIESINQELTNIGFVKLFSNTWFYDKGDKSIGELNQSLNGFLIDESYIFCDVYHKDSQPRNIIYCHNCENTPVNCME